MHELSVVRALLDQVRAHAPEGASLRYVRLRVGPMQSIVPEALRCAWHAAINQTALDGAKLIVEYRPWRLSCTMCGRQWDSDEPYAPCACGFDQPALSGSDELTLLAIEVDDADAIANCTASAVESLQHPESVR